MSMNLLSSFCKLFEFANKYRGSYQGSCPFYCSYSGYQVKTLTSKSIIVHCYSLLLKFYH